MQANVCGIYLLRNTMNGKVYVGQSIHTHIRWGEHKKSAKRGDKSHLYDAMRKYGADVFEHEILEVCTPPEFDVREAYWMEQYDCLNPDKGYNLMPAGQLGRVMDEDCRERIASKLRGRKVSPERLAQMRIASTGRTHSEETKAKMSASTKGRKKSPEAVAKQSEALKCKWKQMTESEKKVYGEKRSGFKHTEAAKAAMSDARKGKPKSAETREKMKLASKARWDKLRSDRAAMEASSCN